MQTLKMDTQIIKDYIHQLQIEQLTALGEFREQHTASLRDFREEWVKGHTEIVSQVMAIKEQVGRQNGNVAALQAWQNEHPAVCEVKAVIALLTKEIDSLKLQIANRAVADKQKAEDDKRWEARLLPVLKVLGILAVGAVGAKIPELGKLLKLW